MRKNEEGGSSGAIRLMSSALIGGVAALIGCVVILAIAAALISGGVLGDDGLYPITIAACVVGSLVGGRIAVRRMGSRALPTGVCTGAIFVLLVIVIGILCVDNMSLGANSLGLVCGGLAGGAVAGLLGGKRKKKRRK